MTESEWLSCTDPTQVLEFLRAKGSDRTLRLFGVAICRRLWNLLTVELRSLLEASERYSEGQSTASEVHELAVHTHPQTTSQQSHLAYEAVRCCADLGYNTSRGMDERAAVLCAAYYAAGAAEELGGMAAVSRERQVQMALLRDIFANPFRPITINPIWLPSTVTNLAEAAYDERPLPSGELDPARLAALSKALEEAGCDDADILGHLRSTGPHVRGCWVIDLILGKR